MDTLQDRFRVGVRTMRDAFVAVSDLARRAGVDEDAISELHGEFFDGHVEVKDALADVLSASGARSTPVPGT